MKKISKKINFISVVFIVLSFSIGPSLPNEVFGQKMSRGITILPEEMIRLPRWCQIRMTAMPRMRGKVGAESVPDSVMLENAKWEKFIGDKAVYNSVHHYCYALNWINRYKQSFVSPYDNVEKDREIAIRSALADFKYMRDHGERLKKTPLYKPLIMREAYLFTEQGDLQNAIARYLGLIKSFPSYTPPYIEYARLLKSIGNTSEALNILEIGLESTNGSALIKEELNSFSKNNNKD